MRAAAFAATGLLLALAPAEGLTISDWLTPPAPGAAYPSDEADRQWAVLLYDLKQTGRFAAFAPEAYRTEALVGATDRDPLDILLRRTSALLADLRARAATRDLTPEQGELEALWRQASSVAPASQAARRALFDRLLPLRRRIAFANPALDFSELLFIKRELRGVMEHCCDQYYGQQQRSGGGLFALTDPFGPAPALRDLLGGEGGAFVVMVENHRFVSYTPLGDLLDQNGDVVLTVHKKQVVKAAFVNKPLPLNALKPDGQGTDGPEAATSSPVQQEDAPPPAVKRARQVER